MSDRASYFKFLFDKAKNIEGVVKGMDAVSFFQKSGLPTLTLRDIWNLSSIRKQGFLMQDQFKLALKYIALAQRGFPVSQQSLHVNQDQKALPKFEGIDLPKPTASPTTSLLQDPFAELASAPPATSEVKIQAFHNYLHPPQPLIQSTHLPQIGIPSQSSLHLNTGNNVQQSLSSLQSNNLLDLDIDPADNGVKNLMGSFRATAPPDRNVQQSSNLLSMENEVEMTATKSPGEEEDFDDFEAAEEEEQTKGAKTVENNTNLIEQESNPGASQIQPKQDKFESFLSKNLLNFTTPTPQPKYQNTQQKETKQQKSQTAQVQKNNLKIEQNVQKEPGGSRLSLLDAAFAELDLDLGKSEQKEMQQQDQKQNSTKKQQNQELDDFDDFQEAEEQESQQEQESQMQDSI